jgi:hypothetical protein
MMVDGAEEGQLKGPIDVLAPYTSQEQSTVVRAVQNIRRSLLPGDEADRLRSKCARAVELLDSYAAVHPANSQLRRFPSSTT